MQISEQRLLEKTLKTGACWLWQGAKDAAGYGYISRDGARRPGSKGASGERVHRVSYRLFKGEIATGLEIDHLCKVRNCLNPDHLEAVDRRTNILRSDSPGGVNARKTHCAKGHAYSPENTRIEYGKRRCLICIKAWKRDLRERQKLKAGSP